MDRVDLDKAGRPLQIRSGHTPVNIGLLGGCALGGGLALPFASAQSGAVSQTLASWAVYLFYAVLLISSAVALAAVWRSMPTRLDDDTYRVIVRKLVWERMGLYGVAGSLSCFAISALAANAGRGLAVATMLGGIAIGLVCRARQTHADVHKLHTAVECGSTTSADLVADPDEST